MDVQCRVFFATEVKVLNMSLGGIALSLNKRLNIGTEYTIKIESEGNTISLKGVVVWANFLVKEVKGKNLPTYEVGIRFQDVLTSKGADIVSFIRENISDKAIKSRVDGLRMKIIQPQKTVILDDHDSYSVKMIGLGGMLIECAEKLDVDERFQMEMALSEDSKPIKFTGRTAYTVEVPGNMPIRYATGVEFMEMNEKNRARLKEFIDILQNI